MKKRVHENSVETYRGIASSTFPRRQKEVLDVYRARKVPLTDREVMQALGHVDPNKVRPAITSLVALRVLFEIENVRDAETGKTVRRCGLERPWDPAQRELFPVEEVES